MDLRGVVGWSPPVATVADLTAAFPTVADLQASGMTVGDLQRGNWHVDHLAHTPTSGALYSGGLVPDPAYPGAYTDPYAVLTPDPEHPGLYLSGA